MRSDWASGRLDARRKAMQTKRHLGIRLRLRNTGVLLVLSTILFTQHAILGAEDGESRTLLGAIDPKRPPSGVVVSSDAKHAAWATSEDVVLDGSVVAKHDVIIGKSLQISISPTCVWYLAMDADGVSLYRVVPGGKPERRSVPYSGIRLRGAPRLGGLPAGVRVTMGDGCAFLTKQGHTLRSGPLPEDWLFVSPRADHTVFCLSNLDEDGDVLSQELVWNSKPVSGPKAMFAPTVVVSSDGKRVGWVFKDESGFHVSIDGKPGEAWKEVGAPAFSEDGLRSVYMASDGTRAYAVVDGTARTVEGVYVGCCAIGSGDGQVAYESKFGEKYGVLVGGKARPGRYDTVDIIGFMGNGARLWLAIRDGGRCRLIVDGKECKDYESVTAPIFSPDLEHVAYRGREGNTFFVVVDGKEMRELGSAIWPAALTNDLLRFVTWDDKNNIYRVEVNLEKAPK